MLRYHFIFLRRVAYDKIATNIWEEFFKKSNDLIKSMFDETLYNDGVFVAPFSELNTSQKGLVHQYKGLRKVMVHYIDNNNNLHLNVGSGEDDLKAIDEVINIDKAKAIIIDYIEDGSEEDTISRTTWIYIKDNAEDLEKDFDDYLD